MYENQQNFVLDVQTPKRHFRKFVISYELQLISIISSFKKHPDSRREVTKKDDVLDGLVTGVNEPWIRNFLTKTLEMAVNGEKGILTSEQDGREAVPGEYAVILLNLQLLFQCYTKNEGCKNKVAMLP